MKWERWNANTERRTKAFLPNTGNYWLSKLFVTYSIKTYLQSTGFDKFSEGSIGYIPYLVVFYKPMDNSKKKKINKQNKNKAKQTNKQKTKKKQKQKQKKKTKKFKRKAMVKCIW